jgi:adenylate cyclase
MEAPPLQRKHVAILAADVAGYSRLMEADEEQALATLSAQRRIIDEAIRQASRRHRLEPPATACLRSSPARSTAAHAAVEIQNSLAETNDAAPQDRRMEFRIGLNVGDVMVKDGDIFGDGVNIAARLEALAEPGGICVSIRADWRSVRCRPRTPFRPRRPEEARGHHPRPLRETRFHRSGEAGRHGSGAQCF